MRRLFIIIFIVALVITNSIFAGEMLQVRQRIGQETLAGLYHNEPYLGLEFLYNNKPKMTLGVGPRYAITRKGITFNAFGYLAVIANPAKAKWSVEEAEGDIFLNVRSGKLATLARTKFKRNFTGTMPKKYYWGEDFLGYQATKSLQVQLRTEWKYSGKINSVRKDLVQSVGLGWSKKLLPVGKWSPRLNGYLGVEAKKPHNKAGWVELLLIQE